VKKVLKFFLILATVIIIPAFLAPIIYPWLGHKYPFERILSRLVMIFGIAAVLYLMMRDFSSFKRFGFVPIRNWYQWILSGLGLGILVIFSLEVFQTFMGVFDVGIRLESSQIPGLLVKAFCTALIVGTIEEFFFRGFVFVSLARLIHWRLSFVLTNLFYAFLHFFHGTKEHWVHPTAVDSLRVMLNWFTPLAQWQLLLPEFFGLFLFGCILSYAFLKSGGLYLPIGIHAGAVFLLKIDVMFFGHKGNFPVWLVGGKNFTDGVLGWIFLLAFWGLLWIILRKRPWSSEFFEKRQVAG